MKIRVNKFFFIANIVVLLLMLMGSLLPLFIIDKGQYTFLLFIPASIILILFILNFLSYFFSIFEVNEEGFIKYILGRKNSILKKMILSKLMLFSLTQIKVMSTALPFIIIKDLTK